MFAVDIPNRRIVTNVSPDWSWLGPGWVLAGPRLDHSWSLTCSTFKVDLPKVDPA